VRRCVVACAIALTLLTAGRTAASAAATDATGADRHGRWTFSVDFSGGATTQYQDAAVESFCENGGIGNPLRGIASCDFLIDNTMAPLRPSDSGEDAVVAPLIGVGLELLTPRVDLPGGPRFFVESDLDFLFDSVHNIAIEGDASRVRLPDTAAGPTSISSIGLNGTGSRTSSDINRLAFGAGLGAAFPFEFRGRQLWIKPSIGWYRSSITVDGRVVGGLQDGAPASGLPEFGPQIREIILTGRQRLTLDGIGPGLELELEAGRFGPLGLTVFGNMNTYRILGDRDAAFSDVETKPALPPVPGGNPNGLPADTYTASWRFSVSPWLFRGSVGIRFQWLGD